MQKKSMEDIESWDENKNVPEDKPNQNVRQLNYVLGSLTLVNLQLYLQKEILDILLAYYLSY